MKEHWLNELENKLTDIIKDIIQDPFSIECCYKEKTLTIYLNNLDRNKTYLVAAIRGKRANDNAYIDLFYVMPHFQGNGVGHTVLDYYSEIQKTEGESGITLKPVPVLPENYNPWECLRLYAWLGKKEHSKMSRQQLVNFYRSAGFKQLYPGLTSEMQCILTA